MCLQRIRDTREGDLASFPSRRDRIRSIRANLDDAREARLKTEFFEADPFTLAKGSLLLTADTDYRFEKSEEFFLDGRGKFRVVYVVIRHGGGVFSREILLIEI